MHDHAGNFTLTVIDSMAGLTDLRPEWDVLLQSTQVANPYQSAAFVLTWFAHFGRDRRIHTVAIRRDGALVAVAPFAVTRIGIRPAAFELLVSAGTEHGDYGEPLIADDGGAAGALLADHLADLVCAGTTVVNLRRLRDDGQLLDALARRDDVRKVPTAPPAEAALVRFDLMDDPARTIEAIAKRRDVPRNLRRLSERHQVEERGLDASVGVAMMERLLAARWKQSEGPRAFSTPEIREFTYDFAQAMVASQLAELHGLFADDDPVCVTLDLQVGKRRVGDLLAVNPAFHRFGPGQLQIYMVLQKAIADGVVELDFRAGEHPYKFRWANARRVSQSVCLVKRGRVGDAQLLARRAAMSFRARTLGKRSVRGVPRVGRGRRQAGSSAEESY